MKKALIVILLLATFCLPVIAADQPKTEQEKLGYAIGMNIGMNMKQQQVDVEPSQVAAGLVAALKGDKTELSQEEMGKILTDYQQKMQMKQMEKMVSDAAENEKLGKDYLTANAKKDGVITLESGLQYKVLTDGQGATPAPDSKVEVHYRGTLIDGTEFDSSYSRGTPASFPVNGVIPGWTEALQLMKEGDKWQLVIPSQLAYAERGAPPVIPPNAALVFEVELLKVL
jgi:FKBP-type peptidyl-prolyl cis-trans isomerase